MKVHLLRDGDFGRIVLDRPPANTILQPVFADSGQLSSFLADPDLRGVIVSGAGRHFCGGADIEALRLGLLDPDRLAAALDSGKTLLRLLADSTVPVVAAIRGQCLGAGLEIALSCHLRVAAESALLGFPESTLGLIPGLGGTVGDGDRVDRRARTDLLLTGRMVGAEEARSMGLVDRVVPAGDVNSAAEALLRAWTKDRSPGLVRILLEAMRNARRLPREDALRLETRLFIQAALEAKQ